MKKEHFVFQFISFPDAQGNHLPSIQKALDCGVQWIQLRVKDDRQEVEKQIVEVKKLCQQYQATFILNDYPDLVAKYDLDGVHIGKKDLPAREARAIIGAEKILGRTCNNFQDLEDVQRLPIDYIGFGPYRFTKTKESLSPVLGKEVFGELASFRKQKKIPPIVGIGGIVPEDIADLQEFAIEGIAVSGIFRQKTEKELETFLEQTQDGFTKNRR
ncbi:MAG: thiamine phosphate synthase [Flavobacteriales bacterium]|jgi:thiamine-phosphate pyrophosphorylase|nr:thiamine phosphate synthase [Flavobacteriales bacterium]